jgi:hypothetical protein
MFHRTPFGMWPKIMVTHGVYNAVKWLNTFPPKGGLTTTYSPRTIITGRNIDYKRHCKIPFGSYVQAVTENAPTNTPRERTIDAIFLRALDNIQGGFEVMNLKTGKPITRHRVIEVPITEQVIKRVEQLAARQGFKPHAEPIFRTYSLLAGVNGPNNDNQNDDSDDDEDYEPELAGHDDDSDDESYDDDIDEQELQDLQNEGVFTPGVDDDDDSVPESDARQIMDDSDDEDSVAPEESDEEVEDDNNEDVADDDNEIEAEDPIPAPPEPRRSTRPSKPPVHLEPSLSGKSYKEVVKDNYKKAVNHLITQVLPDDTFEYTPEEAVILAEVFVQVYNMTQGIRKFGERGEQAAFIEAKQLHDRNCFRPIDVNTLTQEERRNAMNALMLLTEKRDGTIKGRQVTDGSKQRNWMTKEEAASPTVALESIFITAAIEAREGREVAIVDLPNAFIQTLNQVLEKHHKRDILKVRGPLADLLIQIAPDFYGPYATKENGVTVLYLEILRALYGMIKSPLLFYRKLRKDLEDDGFEINPYDICVANKMINGNQITVTWHVDDLKVSHVEPKVVDDFIEWARSKYEDVKITKMKPSRGKIHNYLGMVLDYSEPGKVKIQMKDYIKKMLEEFPSAKEVEALKRVSTPAAEHLFRVNPKAEKLNPEKAEEFHTTVAKALFLCKRARPDLQPTVPFLCTRVKAPDQDDWKKLLRMMKYLQQTIELELTLEAADENGVVICKWYPDAAFAVHDDCKSHTGAVLTLGKGAVNTISAKQKLNTKSSTEAELVAVDDVVAQAMWTRNFLEAQGYKSKTTIYQDNTSAILLEKNGKESSSKRTRHINIRYFYITDCIAKKYMNVEYCPTDDMIGDFPSKPLLGRKFKKHRSLMMNTK